jgi:hypothetical protein
MRRDRLAYLLFVLVGAAQLGALVLIGDSQIRKGGLLLMVLLVVWLGRHSRTAWWLFTIGNGALLLFGAIGIAGGGGHVLWGDVIALLLGSALLLAILLSRGMRAWVRPAAITSA